MIDLDKLVPLPEAHSESGEIAVALMRGVRLATWNAGLEAAASKAEFTHAPFTAQAIRDMRIEPEPK